jgi:hypothetical protein
VFTWLSTFITSMQRLTKDPARESSAIRSKIRDQIMDSLTDQSDMGLIS